MSIAGLWDNSLKLCSPTIAVSGGVKSGMYEMLEAVMNHRSGDRGFQNRPDVRTEILGFNIDIPDSRFEYMRGKKPFITVIDDIDSDCGSASERREMLMKKLEIIGRSKDELPIIMNGDRRILADTHVFTNALYYYGIDNMYCRFKAYDIAWLDDGSEFTIDCGSDEQRIRVFAMGRKGIYNALAAYAVGYLCGLDPYKTAEIIENTRS